MLNPQPLKSFFNLFFHEKIRKNRKTSLVKILRRRSKRNNIEINITAKNNWAFIDFGIVAAHAFLSAKELFSDTKIGFISKDSIFVSYAE